MVVQNLYINIYSTYYLDNFATLFLIDYPDIESSVHLVLWRQHETKYIVVPPDSNVDLQGLLQDLRLQHKDVLSTGYNKMDTVYLN